MISIRYIFGTNAGSCWAFSSVAALEGLNHLTTGNLVSLPEQELVECMSPISCQGDRPENAYNFVEYQHRFCGYNANGLRYRAIEGYEDIHQNDEIAIKCAVVHQPVTIGIDPVVLHHYNDGIASGKCSQGLSPAVAILSVWDK